jgi:hypothetical protein
MTAPTIPALATAVALGWARSCPGIIASRVGLSLPPVEKWAGTGFISCPLVVGGSTDMDYAYRRPIHQFDCWAAALNSDGSAKDKPPYGQAEALATALLNYTYQPVPVLALPPAMQPVWIGAHIGRSEVQWLEEPEKGFAHYSVDIEIQWIERNPA